MGWGGGGWVGWFVVKGWVEGAGGGGSGGNLCAKVTWIDYLSDALPRLAASELFDSRMHHDPINAKAKAPSADPKNKEYL